MIPTKELQIALHEYQEWGEKLRTPRDVRISALLPHRTTEEIQKIVGICKEVEDFAWDVATEARDHGLHPNQACERIKAEFPFMSEENLSRTFSQAMYYTLK